MLIPYAKETFKSNGKKATLQQTEKTPNRTNSPEFKSRPGLKALLLTVVDSLSQLIVLDTLVLKFPSNLKRQQQD